MLALIEDELTAVGVDYPLHVGSTTDRELPIFLISLKAGGVELKFGAPTTSPRCSSRCRGSRQRQGARFKPAA